ncbi:MAG: hypothetical protein A3F67_09730 [Verrucomicrobia bacterium RIFCSPHIGHO2_12_FULL_41_10]|nr:MAG: hypothetical protein A3F67_09730 [Verrucomicrobia bacterium RIFCSPHIGHO2_12_FULL_41_10]
MPQNVFSNLLRTVKVCHELVKILLKQTPYKVSSISNHVSRLKPELIELLNKVAPAPIYAIDLLAKQAGHEVLRKKGSATSYEHRR